MIKNKIAFTLGCVLLTPVIISILAFVLEIFGVSILDELYNNNWLWVGDKTRYGSFSDKSGGGGYTSGFPFYIGFLALAGSYLISISTNNEE